MDYSIGDTVVHWTHGIGKVIAIDEMNLAGTNKAYFVVEVGGLKLWVPAEEAMQGSLRFPMNRTEFQQMIDSLQTPGEPLPDNQYKRKTELRDRIQKRSLADLCNLIRDLVERSRHHTLNQNDSAVLFRAEEYLLDEWVLALGTEREEAQRTLDALLHRESTEIKE